LVTFAIDVALPESLPLSVTIALAHTAKKLQNKNVLVKYLSESETMGGVDNLCLTKTGFVTKNLLSVAEIFVEDRITNIISRETMSEDTCRLLSLAIVMNSQATPRFIQ
jgi:P-type E1-E2 ATPase